MRWFAFALSLSGCLSGSDEPLVSRRNALDLQLRAAGWITPDVPTWEAEQLQRALEQGHVPVVVDVREAREQAVSMLPGAIPLADYEDAGDRFAGRIVVVYCTVGVRSGKWTQKARNQGIDAYNLDGGVLAWSWVGGVFESNGATTQRVHVWSKAWNLLEEGYVGVW